MNRRGRCSRRTRARSLAIPLLLVAAVAGLATSDAVAGKRTDLQTLLDERPSPGSIALLWEHASRPEVTAKLAAALREVDPRTRAAAARVANVANLRSLLPDLAGALDAETDLDAAGEVVRAIASLGGPADQEKIVRAIGRFDGRIDAAILEMLARARGPRAIDWYFGERAALHLFGPLLQPFFRLSSRGDAAVLSSAGSRALQAGDPESWNAILEAAGSERLSLDRPTFLAAFAHELVPIRVPAAWSLLSEIVAMAPDDPEALLASIEAARAAAPPESEEAAAFEMLGRALGRAPVESESLNEWMRSSPPSKFDGIDLPWRAAHVTAAESMLLEERVRRKWSGLSHEDYLRATSPRKGPGDAAPMPLEAVGRRPAIAKTVGAFPRGFVLGAVARSRCRPSQAWEAVVAEIEFDAFGRPVGVHVDPEWNPSGECRKAAEALFASALEIGEPVDSGPRRQRILLLHDDFVSCVDPAGDREGPEVVPVEIDDSLQPPKRVARFDPIFPEEARKQRSEGKVVLETVVSRTGCVREVRVIEATPPFTLAAIDAVSRWKYEPARRDGRPVATIVTAIVEFRIGLRPR